MLLAAVVEGLPLPPRPRNKHLKQLRQPPRL
jgi:hypothetical protein